MVCIARNSSDKYQSATSEDCLQNELKPSLPRTTSYDHHQQRKNTKAPTLKQQQLQQKQHRRSYNNGRCYNIQSKMQFCGDAKSADKNVKNFKKVKTQKYRKWRSLISGFNVVFLIVIVAPFYFNGLFCQGKIF